MGTKEIFCIRKESDVGDLVIKVCSDLLRIPIIVVTSLNGTPFVPFIPDDAVTDQLPQDLFGTPIWPP